MKRLATRVYTFQELMNRIDMEFWSVHHHGQEQYTFVPVRYKGEIAMKTFYWILACGLTIWLMQYSLFKENGAPRQFNLPVAVVR